MFFTYPGCVHHTVVPDRGSLQVWTGSRKIAAVGVQFSRGVSAHGAALNVCLDTAWFRRIVPCGDPETQVTTMSEILRRPIEVSSVQYQLAWQFMREHGCDQWESISPDDLLKECERSGR
jgi:lipoyl(octanoyl) transferase